MPTSGYVGFDDESSLVVETESFSLHDDTLHSPTASSIVNKSRPQVIINTNL